MSTDLGDVNISANEIQFEDSTPDFCAKRCCAEWNYPGFFGLEEGRRELDVGATFGTRKPLLVLGKLICGAAIWSTLVVNWVSFGVAPAWFLAYMTEWALMFASIYAVFSILNSICPPAQPRLAIDGIGIVPKITWIAASISVHWTLLATFLFWAFVFSGTVTYSFVAAHGGAMIFVWILAFYCDRIPLRWKHFIIVWVGLFLYLIWTVLQATVFNAALGGNPASPDTDVIYPALDWKTDPLKAAILSLIMMVVAVPLFYWLLWLVSLYSFPCGFSGQNRRYLSHKSNNALEDNGEGGGGSVRSPTNVNIYEVP